ncbi:aspartate aminotransferase family protein [Solihabitans fulvus]|uniref:Aspartate aminotransferase family protein n=1 Tax=Solihabitans fulvus TaxID=1892852 RepID=A0A5B2WGB4_9PSEU|nr:aminotransferase class III-fold pyridoxal phosphate-dependent enzyme [Solihabitans fulvus]KAA2250154.1 aspartate aminotransferase family protein [Solihabitans fulvus]
MTPEFPDRDEVLKLYDRHLGRATAKLAAQVDLPVEVRSAGARVWDEQDREYLDCGGYGVFLLGHRHPDVLKAVHDQLDRHPLATRSLLSAELAYAAQRLAGTAPAGLEHVYFASTGAEAVETAIKLARAGGRRRLIAMDRGFHGKTLGALSITNRPIFQQPFRPLLPDVDKVAFGDIDELNRALAASEDKACVVVEPVQGEGGVRIPPPGYLAAVAEACRAAGAYLVVDEIQTGLGRLGEWWGCTAEGVVPDMLLTGKGLGGGVMPVSAVLATDEVFAPLDRAPRLHSSTFSGAPIAMAAVLAAIDVIEREDLVRRAATLGESLLTQMSNAVWEAGGDAVREIRGRGLLIGIEFGQPRAAGRFVQALMARRVIVTNPLAADNVVRFSPPAVLSGDEIGWLLEAFSAALAESGGEGS